MIAYYSEDTKDKGTRNAKFLAIIADKIHFTVDVDLEVLE